MKKKSKVIKHLKGDIKTFKHEAAEDRGLIKDLGKEPKKKRAKGKIEKVMHEYKEGALHSGSKKGPKVKKKKQALAIAFAEMQKARGKA